MQNLTYNLKRAAGYMLAFVLFYEPFMFFNQLASTFITDTSFSSIHVPYARIPLANIVTGEWLATSTISLIFCLLLAVTSLWFGPLFCGKLCPTGAFSELLGSLLPDKHKIDWPNSYPCCHCVMVFSPASRPSRCRLCPIAQACAAVAEAAAWGA